MRIMLDLLLKFEPYLVLPASIVQEICNGTKPLSESFLQRFNKHIGTSALFIEIVTIILNDSGILESNVDNMLDKLKEWCRICKVTYQQLHKSIDRFSIFAGLNILV